jgi:hypothetical protein
MNGKLLLASAAWLALAPAAAAQHVPEPAPELEPESPWEFSGSAYVVDPPGSDAHATALLYGQRGPLHLELRFNYEDIDTGSLFTGWTFEGGDELAFAATPMLGFVGGQTEGVAPGLELDLGWRRFAFYSESEYLFDTEDSSDDFFYSWSTLTYGLTEWLDAGLVAERTKLVDTDFELQHGLALEFTLSRLELALYSYNLGTNDAYTVVSLGGSL